MSEGENVAYIECACGHLARLPEADLGGRWGRDLYRRLRCSACGRIGQAEVRIVWSVKGDPFASYGMVPPKG